MPLHPQPQVLLVLESQETDAGMAEVMVMAGVMVISLHVVAAVVEVDHVAGAVPGGQAQHGEQQVKGLLAAAYVTATTLLSLVLN